MFDSNLDIVEESVVISEIGDLLMDFPVLMPDSVTSQVVMATPTYEIRGRSIDTGKGFFFLLFSHFPKMMIKVKM